MRSNHVRRVAPYHPVALFLLFAATFSVMGASPASAQYVQSTTISSEGTPTTKTDGGFGHAIEAVGSISGNPVVIVGAPREHGENVLDAGRAYLVNGNTGNILEALDSDQAQTNGRFGASVGVAGDVNDDGIPDVVVGAPLEDAGEPLAGQVYLYDGGNGTHLQTLQTKSGNVVYGREFGRAVAGVGDIDGDGTPDVVVGAPEQPAGGASRAGKAYIMSGADGNVIQVLTGAEEDTGLFGSAVTGVGDIIGDSTPDILVGARREDVGGNSEAGKVYLIDGGDFSQTVITSANAETGGQFGRAVTEIGTESDPDFLIGAYNEEVSGATGAGRAYIIDGANPTSSPIATLESKNPEGGGQFGRVVSSIGDIDRDGVPDALVGAPEETVNGNGGAGRAYVLSGNTGNVLDELTSQNVEADGRFGWAVTGYDDLDSDDMLNAVVGAPEEGVSGTAGAGRSYAFTTPSITLVDGRNGELYDPPSASAGDDNVPVGRFKLSSDANGSTLGEVTISNYAPPPSGITSIELWTSSDNGFDAGGTDSEIASTSYTDNVTFSSIGEPIPTDGVYLFVVVDLGSDAGGEYEPAIQGEADIGFTDGVLSEYNSTQTNSFSDAHLSESSSSLPVELTQLGASVTDEGTVTLHWTTASETNNAEFRVMRKVKGKEQGAKGNEAWVQVGSIAGAGTTTEPQSYRYADENLPYEVDVLQYRLQQVDTDGTTHLSDVVTVERSAPEQVELLGTYPNPSRTRATVRLAIPKATDAADASLQLYDVMGRQVRTVNGVSGGRSTVTLDVDGLSSGVYVLRLMAGSTTRTQRMMVVR